MCICLNCKYLKQCKIYNKIEEKHNEKHISSTIPSFHPISPIIKINVCNQKQSLDIEWDIYECLSYEEKIGEWLK